MLRLGIEAGKCTLDAAVEFQISGIPVSAAQLIQDGVEAVMAPLHQRGLKVCQIGAFGFNPLSTDTQLEQQKAIVTKAIPMAADIGCPYIVINGGNYHPNSFGAVDARNFTQEAIDQIARVLEPLILQAEKYGVYLSIEPYLKTAICSPERFLELQKKVGSGMLRCNVDVTSLYGYHELWNPDAAVNHICNSLAGHYGLVHIKDIALKEGFHIHIDLAPLGSSRTNWGQLLKLVEPHVPEDSWVILEHVQTMEEAKESVGLLRQAAHEAGVTLD